MPELSGAKPVGGRVMNLFHLVLGRLFISCVNLDVGENESDALLSNSVYRMTGLLTFVM